MYLISSVFKRLLLCNVCEKQKKWNKKIEKKKQAWGSTSLPKGGFHVMSSLPCWWTVNKRSLISSLCLSTSICSFHHCYLCLPRLHENHLYGTSSLNLPCMWMGLSSYQSVVINGELTSKADPSYFLLPLGLCWWLASWMSDIKNCVDMKIKSARRFLTLPEQCCESKQWFSYVNLW